MKPSSFSRLALATAVCLFCSSFFSPQLASASISRSGDNAHFYYYLTDDDSFDCYNSVSDEIVHLEILYGAYVNTNPFGGTLVASGYLNNITPHQIWPSSYLYAHF
jgi:hypothetical protein